MAILIADMYILYAMICIDIDIYSVERCAVPSHVTPASRKWLQLMGIVSLLQSNSDDSDPEQRVCRMNIGPVPSPKEDD